jgi:CheY-like chemotaxis protein
MAKILYVENNEDNGYMLKRRLERAGFEVVVAPDGEQGLAVAHDQRPDLILMDLRLPVLDGCSALHALQFRAHPPDAPGDASDGGWRHGAVMVDRGRCRIARVATMSRHRTARINRRG